MLADAKTLPAMESGANILRGFIPEIAGDLNDLNVATTDTKKTPDNKDTATDGPRVIDKAENRPSSTATIRLRPTAIPTISAPIWIAWSAPRTIKNLGEKSAPISQNHFDGCTVT